jgi:siroheme synthase
MGLPRSTTAASIENGGIPRQCTLDTLVQDGTVWVNRGPALIMVGHVVTLDAVAPVPDNAGPEADLADECCAGLKQSGA